MPAQVTGAHGLRSAAVSLYAARGLPMLETATIMGQADPGVTWKHYARLYDRSDVNARSVPLKRRSTAKAARLSNPTRRP